MQKSTSLGISRIAPSAVIALMTATMITPTQSARAFLANTGYWRTQYNSLKYTTSTQSIFAGNCSGVVTVKTYNPSGALTNVTSNLTVNLSGSGTTTFYSDANCSSAVSSVTVASGSNSANFYFIDTSTSTITVTAAAASYTSALQSETIDTNPFVWTGGGGNTTWSTAANWSGGSAPGASNIALFDGTCVSNCSPTMTSNVSIGGLRITSAYSGTITQNAGVTITLASNWYQGAGTFSGGDSSITIGGITTLAGGSFTSTSGTLTESADFTVSGSATFAHHSGTVAFQNSNSVMSIITPGTSTYNNVTFQGYGSNHTLSGTMTVNGTLTLSDTASLGYSLNGGTIAANGNVNVNNNGYVGTTLVKLTGTSSQTLTSASGGNLPSLQIASSGGTVTLSGSFIINNGYTYTSGSVNASAASISFSGYANQTVVPGTIAYNNVTFAGYGAKDTISGTMTVNGTLTLGDTATYGMALNGGTILASGNVAATNYGYPGTTLIKLVGSANQTLSGTSANSTFPTLEIASTGGTVTFSGFIPVAGNYTYTSGTVAAGTSTMVFISNQTVTPGTAAYYNVNFGGYATTITLLGTMTVNGTLTFNGTTSSPPPYVNSGTVLANGDIISSNYGVIGTANIQMVGGSAANLSQNSSTGIPVGFSINKTAGVIITLASDVNLGQAGQNLTVTSGNVNMAGHALTVASSVSLNGNTLTKNGGTLTVNGSVVSGTGSLYGGTVNP